MMFNEATQNSMNSQDVIKHIDHCSLETIKRALVESEVTELSNDELLEEFANRFGDSFDADTVKEYIECNPESGELAKKLAIDNSDNEEETLRFCAVLCRAFNNQNIVDLIQQIEMDTNRLLDMSEIAQGIDPRILPNYEDYQSEIANLEECIAELETQIRNTEALQHVS